MIKGSEMLVFQSNQPIEESGIWLGLWRKKSSRKLSETSNKEPKEIIRNSTFYNFMKIRFLMQGAKARPLQVNSSPRLENTWLRTTFEIYTCVFAEKWFSKSRKFNTNRAFWHKLKVNITERYDRADVFFPKKGAICPFR